MKISKYWLVSFLIIGLYIIIYLWLYHTGPFWDGGDIFVHAQVSQKIIDTGKIGGNDWPFIYSYTPLLFLETAILSIISGLSVFHSLAGLGILLIIILSGSVYTLTNKLINNRQVAAISCFFALTLGDRFFWTVPDYQPYVFVFLNAWILGFMISFWFILFFMMAIKKKSILYFIISGLLFITISLMHVEVLFIPFITGLLYSFYWMYTHRHILKEKKYYKYILSVMAALTIILTISRKTLWYVYDIWWWNARPSTSPFFAEVAEPILSRYGVILLVFGLIGLYYFFKKNTVDKIYKPIMACFIIGLLLLAYQDVLFNLYLQPDRYRTAFVYILAVFAGYGLYEIITIRFYRMRRGKIMAIVTLGLIGIIGITTSLQTLKNDQFHFNWKHVNSILWARNNLSKGLFFSDPYTSLSFDYMSGLTSVTLDYREFNRNEQSEQRQRLKAFFFAKNPEQAWQVAKKENIAYVIYDNYQIPYLIGNTTFTPTPGEYFEQLHQENILARPNFNQSSVKIFRVK